MNDNKDDLKIADFYAVFKNNPSKNVTFQHYHDSYEMQFFINATLKIFIKDIKYEVRDGDVVFINEFEIHRFIYEGTTTNIIRYVINFKRDYILPNLKVAGIEYIFDYLKDSKYTHAATNLKERTELEYLFKAIINVNNSKSENMSGKLQVAAVKSYLVLILLRIWELIKNYEPEKSMSKKGRLIQGVIQYIDKNYMLNITLDLLEDIFFIDKFHISHVFREVTSFSLMEYVQQRRVIEAQKMLKNSKTEIVDICFDCGFNNVQHFYRVFKKVSGITPDKYRKL